MARSVALIGLVAAGSSGVARYTVALARALGSVAEDYPGLHLRLLTTTTGAERVGEIGLQVDTLRLRARMFQQGPARIMLEQCHAAAARADLLHFFDLSGPVLAPRRPFVTTIHDASVALGYNALRYAYKRRLQPWALRRARATVAISEFAKAEATRHHGVSPDRISVIHSGPGFVPLPNGSPVRDFGLDDDPTSSTSATSLRARTCRSSCGRSSEASCRPRSYLPGGRVIASQSCARPSRRRGRGSG